MTQPPQAVFRVVVNHEEQYSIWADDHELPEGWQPAGYSGTRQECLDHIDQIWTDIRPLSVRRRIERDRAGRGSQDR
jgi:MbtH protein